MMRCALLVAWLAAVTLGVSADNCVVIDLGTDAFCSALSNTNASSVYSADTITSMAIDAAIEFTGGMCTESNGTDDGSCTLSDIQGDASNACFNAVQDFYCTYYAGNQFDGGSDNCVSSPMPTSKSVADCIDLFETCSGSISDSMADSIDATCNMFACSSDEECSNEECAVQEDASEGYYATCNCPEDKTGSYCQYDKIYCPGDSTCSFHGECDFLTGICECESLFTGDICDMVPCEDDCNGNGFCHSVGVCQCDMGFMGSACQIEIKDAGMTSGELAGAVIGGLLISFIVMGGIIYTCYVNWDD